MHFNLSIIFIIIFFTACSTNNRYVQSNISLKKEIKEQEAKKELAKTLSLNQSLIAFYKEWKNVKYKFGGNSKEGIDCSAFTQKVFKEKFHIDIPRSTRTQVKIGKEIKKSELQLGDLVFFKTGKIDRHVGIYMGDGNFMHASIKGVRFTKLDKPFYKKAYWTSRRIFSQNPPYKANTIGI